MGWIALGVAIALLLLAIYDLTQTKHAILRNFPILGHMRYLLEGIGPELRQYIVTSNDEERPFSRDQRSWVYASSKNQNNYFGFGTDNNLEASPNYLIVKHAPFPKTEPLPGDADYDPRHLVPCAKVMGQARGRAKAYRPESVFYVSAMSYGSLSGPAVEAINRGMAMATGLHNTGEGGVSPYHCHGGDLIWQLGTGYFGARDATGQLDIERLAKTVDANPSIRAIEIKLSQGAKPGRGGMLPGKKVTAEIAAIRGIPEGVDCASPAGHSAFSDVDSMLDVVEAIAARTGLPVGIKSAVGQLQFWHDLADAMQSGERGVDFITIDGGEGGTGAAPLVFSDHVALPFKIGFARVRAIFEDRGIADDIVWAGAGRLGFPQQALLAFAMGCDLVGVAREAMMAIGCIQAQRCHNGHCPTGVATQSKWLMRGLDPTHKASRMANYMITLRKEVMWLTRAVGVEHPSEVTLDDFEVLDEGFGSRPARDVFGVQGIASRGLSSVAHPSVTAAAAPRTPDP